MRPDGRKPKQIRKVKITRNYVNQAEGSVLIEVGDTRVICTASVEDKVPGFLKDSKQGWVTAEYSMLPRSTNVRTGRESSRGKVGGRTHEIQRLIGRALRSVVDLTALNGMTIWIDCDVIQADGGTRTASITGSFVALYDAMNFLKAHNKIEKIPINNFLAAVSVGIFENEVILDLNYEEDFKAEVDMNIVMTADEKFVEIQGTAEENPFTRTELEVMLKLAKKGIKELITKQKKCLDI
ncbi:MAG: ribonuclease PH [Nitrospinota bacterium]|jgi:ribonuclease PH|nr:ribonuclease PH [Nitrospinota bacterium]HJN02621.1 ribonuclease PH [Nitrospinota bacterium]